MTSKHVIPTTVTHFVSPRVVYLMENDIQHVIPTTVTHFVSPTACTSRGLVAPPPLENPPVRPSRSNHFQLQTRLGRTFRNPVVRSSVPLFLSSNIMIFRSSNLLIFRTFPNLRTPKGGGLPPPSSPSLGSARRVWIGLGQSWGRLFSGPVVGPLCF